ncbi:MAG: hypothetical protein ABFE08_17885 [Armatimonadia bacterium]
MNEVTPGLTGLLNMSTIMTPPASMATQENVPNASDTTALMPSYALGGMVGPGGEPIRPNIPGLPGLSGPSSGGMGAQQMELEARRFVQQNPQQAAEIRETVEEALAEGDITMDQVKVLSNMARVALQNPEMYPQLKQAILSQGILEQDELPPDFDQGVMFILLLIGQVVQAPAAPGLAAGSGDGSGPAAPPASVPGSAQPSGAPIPMEGGMPTMATGGSLPAQSPNPDGSIPIKAHEGEYVIPSHVVRAKGTDFFDKLVQTYTQPEE